MRLGNPTLRNNTFNVARSIDSSDVMTIQGTVNKKLVFLLWSSIWVDFVNEKQLLRIKPEVFSIDELKRLHKIYKPLGTVDKSGYVPCPICKELMYRNNWGTHSGVIIDECLTHGTWYDDKELEKIREYVTLGGIEYEKFKLTDNGLTDLDGKLMQKVHQLDKRIDSAYMRARMYSILRL